MVATHSSLILLQIAAAGALESFNFRFLWIPENAN
jgi:hypothetical protein